MPDSLNDCIGCHKLLIGESREAIREIQANKTVEPTVNKTPNKQG